MRSHAFSAICLAGGKARRAGNGPVLAKRRNAATRKAGRALREPSIVAMTALHPLPMSGHWPRNAPYHDDNRWLWNHANAWLRTLARQAIRCAQRKALLRRLSSHAVVLSFHLQAAGVPPVLDTEPPSGRIELEP